MVSFSTRTRKVSLTELAARIFLVTFAIMSSMLSSRKTIRWCLLPSTQLVAQSYSPLAYKCSPRPHPFHQPRNYFKASGKRVNGPHRAYSHQTNLCGGSSNPITALVQDIVKTIHLRCPTKSICHIRNQSYTHALYILFHILRYQTLLRVYSLIPDWRNPRAKRKSFRGKSKFQCRT